MREAKINKERGELLLNVKKAMESNCTAKKDHYHSSRMILSFSTKKRKKQNQHQPKQVKKFFPKRKQLNMKKYKQKPHN